MKNPGIAAVLSFVIPGAGLVYAECIFRGIIVFLVCGWAIHGMIFQPDSRWIDAGIGFVVWIYGIYKARREVDDYNERMSRPLETESKQSKSL